MDAHSYYWRFFRRFGEECWSTWRGMELGTVFAVTFVTYLIAWRDQSVWEATLTAIEANLIVFAVFIIGHLFKTPYLLHKEEVEKTVRARFGVLGIAILLGLMGSIVFRLAKPFLFQLPNITVEAPRIPGISNDSDDLHELVQLLQELITKGGKGDTDDEGQREIGFRLSKDILVFTAERIRSQPTFLPGENNNNDHYIQLSETYYQETVAEYQVRFTQRVASFIAQTESAGLDPSKVRIECTNENGNTVLLNMCAAAIGLAAQQFPR